MGEDTFNIQNPTRDQNIQQTTRSLKNKQKTKTIDEREIDTNRKQRTQRANLQRKKP